MTDSITTVQKTRRGQSALWASYDFANSVLAIAFAFYFSQWLVVERGVPDIAYNAVFAAASALLLLTAPALALMADQAGAKAVYLRRVTVPMYAAYLATGIAVLVQSSPVLIVLLLFLTAHYFYQLSFVFYNALLPDLASPKREGRLSGFGQAANWLGQIAGIALSIPFAAGWIYLSGASPRAQTLLPAVLLSLIIMLPFLLLFRSKPAEPAPSFAAAWRKQWQHLRLLLDVPGMRPFLLAYFFFMDALVTTAANFSIYLQNVFAVSDNAKLALIAGTLLAAAGFAAISGSIADRIGLRRALVILLSAWAIILPLQALSPSFAVLAVLQLLLGGSFGAVWAVTRALMSQLCPPAHVTLGFSAYTLVERGASILGPLTWGAIIFLADGMGTARYRVALGAMGLFVVAGLFIVLRSRALSLIR